MKFSTALVTLALALAGTAEAKMQHRRTGPSATFSPAPSSTPTQVETSNPPATPPAAGTTVKRGVSYNALSATAQFGSKVSWAYNWADNAGGQLPGNREFVPMLWGADSGHTSTWHADASAAIAAGATHLFAFNEPDLSTQSNLTPEQAAEAWMQYMEPFAGQAKLCSPAITNGGAPMGTAWLDDFLSACSGCTIDCIAIHIYDSATNIGYFQNYISDAGTKYGKPTWVTEFGASGTTDQQTTFFQTMLPFLDNLSTVERYAYFMAGDDILVDDNNNLTPLGQVYNTL